MLQQNLQFDTMDNVLKAIELIKNQVREFVVPAVTQVSWRRDPYRVLVSCILSLRTKDETTSAASWRLFKIADTPRKIVKILLGRLEKIIYPVGFYRVKAQVILEASRRIIEQFNVQVPNTLDELLTIKGVGRKTANLVLGLGFGIPAICVDTHVHRISNRLGWVKTKDPYQTEEDLEKIIPKREWIDLNTNLVTFGQNICVPVSPHCSRCYTKKFCKKINVTRSR
jgi:endonuclease-3